MVGMRKVRMALTLIAMIGLVIFAASPAQSQDQEALTLLELRSRTAATQGQTFSAQADAAAGARAALQRQLVALARRRADLEQRVLAAEIALEDALAEQAAARAALVEQRDMLEDLTAALARQQRGAPPLLAVTPHDAARAARANMALAGVTRAIDARANALRAQILALEVLREEIDDKRAELSEADAALTSQRTLLLAAIAEKQRLEQQLRGDAAAMEAKSARLAAEAQSLRDIIVAIEREHAHANASANAGSDTGAPPASSPTPSSLASTPPGNANRAGPAASPNAQPAPQPVVVAAAPPRSMRAASSPRDAFVGVTTPPVLGGVAYRFNDEVDGRTAIGQAFRPRRGAQVVAVADGKVVFADEFKGYGRVLILEVAQGYYVVMTGLGELYAQNGQWVLAGEPVGETPRRTRAPQLLYVEFRTPSGPVDPKPWLDRGRHTAALEKPA